MTKGYAFGTYREDLQVGRPRGELLLAGTEGFDDAVAADENVLPQQSVGDFVGLRIRVVLENLFELGVFPHEGSEILSSEVLDPSLL